VGLLEELGIEPRDFQWQDLALCRGMNPAFFFEDYENDIEVAKQVDQCCLACPAIKECATMGLNGEYGVFGGVYWNGSGRPDVNRNAHKTDEINSKIRERLS
jgi:hypothetical protein